MTTKEMRDVLEKYEQLQEGKIKGQIEFAEHGDPDFQECPSREPNFNFARFDYRFVPAPVEKKTRLVKVELGWKRGTTGGYFVEPAYGLFSGFSFAGSDTLYAYSIAWQSENGTIYERKYESDKTKLVRAEYAWFSVESEE